MATVNVKDAAGSTVAVEKPNSNGRASAANSRPVTLSTEDKTALDAVASQTTAAAILAKIISAPATETKQDAIVTALGTLGTQTTLAAILAKLIAAPATETTLAAILAKLIASAGTDRSGNIVAGGTAQQVAAANADRRSLTIQNISAGDLWVNEIGGTATIDTSASWRVPAGSVFTASTNRAISIIGAVTGQKFTATEI